MGGIVIAQVDLNEMGESYYNEYIGPVVAHLEATGLVTDSDGAKVSPDMAAPTLTCNPNPNIAT